MIRGRPPGMPYDHGYYLSAYALAVMHGFTGTEEEWLESLKGEAGATGPAGATGAPGEKVVLRYSDTQAAIQQKYENDSAWSNVLTLPTIRDAVVAALSGIFSATYDAESDAIVIDIGDVEGGSGTGGGVTYTFAVEGGSLVITSSAGDVQTVSLPGSYDTTYSFSTGAKGRTLLITEYSATGAITTSIPFPTVTDTNTTYNLASNGSSSITLAGSDGTVQTVTLNGTTDLSAYSTTAQMNAAIQAAIDALQLYDGVGV